MYEWQFIDSYEPKRGGEQQVLEFYYQNITEAENLIATYKYMRWMGIASKNITFLTPYNGQAALLREMIERTCEKHHLFGLPNTISTIDRYQGQQNDFVLLSLVRTRNVGHINELGRITVALSRARLGLYVF